MFIHAYCLFAAIELIAPLRDATVKLIPDAQRALLEKTTLAEREAVLSADAKGSGKLGKDAAWRQSKPVTFSWRPTAGESRPWLFEIGKCGDFRDARVEIASTDTNAEGIVTWTLPRANLEIGETYYWRVSGNLICWTEGHPRGCGCPKAKPMVTSQSATFVTEDLAPRWIALEGRVGNIRDLGGRRGADGRRIRQGLVYRGQGLNDNSWDGRIRGRNRLMLEDVWYLKKTLGIRTDLDLRASSETCAQTISPLGPDVQYIQHSSLAYAASFTTAEGKRNMAENFRVFCSRVNYPIYFHCIAGADRTGTLAYVLNGVLGVSRRELETDWESTFYPEIPNDPSDWSAEDHFAKGIAPYGQPDDPWVRKIELYLLDCGITKEEIAAFRAIMLQ